MREYQESGTIYRVAPLRRIHDSSCKCAKKWNALCTLKEWDHFKIKIMGDKIYWWKCGIIPKLFELINEARLFQRKKLN